MNAFHALKATNNTLTTKRKIDILPQRIKGSVLITGSDPF
jgi:hypothetical protein